MHEIWKENFWNAALKMTCRIVAVGCGGCGDSDSEEQQLTMSVFGTRLGVFEKNEWTSSVKEAVQYEN